VNAQSTNTAELTNLGAGNWGLGLSPGLYSIHTNATYGVGAGTVTTLTAGTNSIINQFAGIVASNADVADYDGWFTITGPGGYVILGQVAGANPTNSNVQIFSSTNTTYEMPTDFGSVQTMRPVGCSALLTCVTPKLFTGGWVGGISIPSGTVEDIFLTPNVGSNLANLHEVESYRLLNAGFTSESSKGMHCHWTPVQKSNFDFLIPSQLSNSDLGGIAMAWDMSSVTGIAANTLIFELTISIHFEFTTPSLLWKPMSCIGSDNTRDTILRIAAAFPTAHDNPAHLKKLREFIARASAYVQKNRNWIDPLASAAMKVGSSFLM